MQSKGRFDPQQPSRFVCFRVHNYVDIFSACNKFRISSTLLSITAWRRGGVAFSYLSVAQFFGPLRLLYLRLTVFWSSIFPPYLVPVDKRISLKERSPNLNLFETGIWYFLIPLYFKVKMWDLSLRVGVVSELCLDACIWSGSGIADVLFQFPSNGKAHSDRYNIVYLITSCAK